MKSHVLIVAESLEPTNGWGRYSLDLALGLQKLGYRVSTLVHTKSVLPTEIEQHLGLPLASALLGSNPVGLMQTACAFQRVLTRLKPDIMHITVEPYSLAAGLVLPHATRLVLAGHGTYAGGLFRMGIIKRLLSSLAIQRASLLIALSQYTREDWKNAVPRPLRKLFNQRCQVATGGVPDAFFQSMAEKLADQPAQILFVGQVKPRKGVREAILACDAFNRQYNHPFVFHIVGSFDSSSDYTKELLSLIHDKALDAKIVFHGKVTDAKLLTLYQQADLYLMLPRRIGNQFEGYGLVYLEANARGIPAISSNEGGCREAVSDDVSGYVVAPDDPAAIADRMADILVRRKISASSCIEWAWQNHSSRLTQQLCSAYESLA